MVVDIDLGMEDGVAAVVDRRRMGRGLKVVGDMRIDRKFAVVGSTKLKTDLDHRMFGTRTNLVIAVHKNLQNHPSRRTNGVKATKTR